MDINTSRSSTTPNSSINYLRNWFRDNVGRNGGFKNTSPSDTRVDFSDFSETAIYGFYVRGWSETASTYKNTNNGGVTFWHYAGDGNRSSFQFKVGGRDWTTPNSDNNTGTAFHGLNSGEYWSLIKHRDLPQIGFTIKIGYAAESTTLTYSYVRESDGVTVSSVRDIRVAQGENAHLFIIDKDTKFKKLVS